MLPKIRPYTMPSERDFPANRVAWDIDTQRCALLVHDMQGYFLSAFERDMSPVVELLDNVSALVAHAQAHGMPVFYSAQPGAQSPEERGLLQDFWGPGIGAAHEATQIEPRVAVGGGAGKLIRKHRYSAFKRTSLLGDLAASGRDQLLISGVYAHIGCLASALDAFMSDIRPFLIGDAVADFSAADHAMALAYAANRCAVVTSTAAVLRSARSRQLPMDRAS